MPDASVFNAIAGEVALTCIAIVLAVFSADVLIFEKRLLFALRTCGRAVKAAVKVAIWCLYDTYVRADAERIELQEFEESMQTAKK